MRLLYSIFLLFVVVTAEAQNTPVFNGKQLIDVNTITSWNFSTRPTGWYRIAKIVDGGRGNATFELRESADHSTLRFEIGVNFNNHSGSSFTVTNHSYYSAATFPKLRLLTEGTYADVFLEVYVYPHNNDNQPFYAYTINALADGDWQLLNWIPGVIPSGYTVTEYDTDKLFTVGNIPNGNAFSVARDGNISIGTTSPNSKLTVNGNIRAREIKVENGNWPDYVFQCDYQLPSLQETDKHIKEKGHLPGIPSAKEVKASGIDLGEMNGKLLQKIEELTLHLIEQNKKMSTMQNDIEILKSNANRR